MRLSCLPSCNLDLLIKACGGRVALTGAVALVVVKKKVLQAGACFRPPWHRTYQIGSALILGLALGAAGYFAGPYLSVAVGVACGFVATLAIQAGLWFRRVLMLDEWTWDQSPGVAE